MNLFDLSNKRALITGGTHGLGMAMAEGLAMAGADLVINGSNQNRLDKAVEQYREKGFKANGYLFDVTDEKVVEEQIERIESQEGPIDILINNAAITKRVPAHDFEVADFRRIIDVDLIGPFIVSKFVAKGMIKRERGKIVNICSMMSEMGRDTISAYTAAKGGLKMLTRNLATEWARFNIQVNGIGPGYFATSQTAPLLEKGGSFNDFIISRTPAGRWGTPGDLVGSAIFLSSAASNFVNGHVLYVDGGMLATIGRPINE